MSGIINLIGQHSSKLNILPIIVIMNVIVAILIHFLTKRKIIKYIPSLIMGIIAIIILISGLSIFTSTRGLDLSWIAVFIGSAALVGVFACFIIDLISSIKRQSLEASNPDFKKPDKTRKKVSKNTDNLANKKRVAKKNRSITRNTGVNSKYSSKKIDIEQTNNTIKAKKVSESDRGRIITFEPKDEN